MFHFVEPRVRRVVAERLGLGIDDLVPEVSLADDLAADSLDLLELALALEREFDVQIPEAALEGVRTFRDLLEVVQVAVRAQRPGERAVGDAPMLLVWARVVPPPERASGQVQHAGWLTPYTAEAIAEDAVRAGHGAQLEVTVPASVADACLTRLREEFAWLAERGVAVTVRRHDRAGPSLAPGRPHAAA